jgi:hypothetical protein
MEEPALTGLQRDEADITHDGMCGKTTSKTKKKNVHTES